MSKAATRTGPLSPPGRRLTGGPLRMSTPASGISCHLPCPLGAKDERTCISWPGRSRAAGFWAMSAAGAIAGAPPSVSTGAKPVLSPGASQLQGVRDATRGRFSAGCGREAFPSAGGLSSGAGTPDAGCMTCVTACALLTIPTMSIGSRSCDSPGLRLTALPLAQRMIVGFTEDKAVHRRRPSGARDRRACSRLVILRKVPRACPRPTTRSCFAVTSCTVPFGVRTRRIPGRTGEGRRPVCKGFSVFPSRTHSMRVAMESLAPTR